MSASQARGTRLGQAGVRVARTTVSSGHVQLALRCGTLHLLLGVRNQMFCSVRSQTPVVGWMQVALMNRHSWRLPVCLVPLGTREGSLQMLVGKIKNVLRDNWRDDPRQISEVKALPHSLIRFGLDYTIRSRLYHIYLVYQLFISAVSPQQTCQLSLAIFP